MGGDLVLRNPRWLQRTCRELRDCMTISPGSHMQGSAPGSRSPCRSTRLSRSRCPHLWEPGTDQTAFSALQPKTWQKN